MTRYYISRAVVSIAFGGLFALTGSPWWVALLISAIAFGWFVYAPRSGRYAVHPELGVTALQRDEYTQAINDRSARNAFIVVMLAIASLSLYFGTRDSTQVPLQLLQWTLILGVLAYLISDLIQRRSV
jgi:hypothetical protein